MHSINPPARFYICHVLWPGRLLPQPEEEQGGKKKSLYDSEVSPVNSHKKLSVKSLAAVAHTTQTLQRLRRGFGWVWSCGPNHGQHLEWQTHRARICCAPPDLHRHSSSFSGNRVTWKPWTGEPSVDAKVPALQQECKGPLKWKKKRLWCISNLTVTASLLAFCLHP